MTVLARVLYEDQPRGREYPPHVFVMACVGDTFGWDCFDPRLTRSFEAIPVKGIGNVRRQLRRIERLRRGGAEVHALIDGDQAWRALGLSREASDEALQAKLVGDPAPEGVRVYVLHDNLETLLEVCADEMSVPWDTSRKPSLVHRDRLLMRAATAATGVHERIRGRVEAVDALATSLAEVVRRTMS